MAVGRDKIVQAMEELRERRDNGEPIHLILDEVAAEHQVSSAALKLKAEASWGSPLETDRARHPEHFQILDQRKEVIEESKKVASRIWSVWAAYIARYSERGIDWEHDVKTMVESSSLNVPQLKSLAVEEILRELRRLIALQKTGQIQPPDDSFSFD
jgi:hypothetical protein